METKWLILYAGLLAAGACFAQELLAVAEQPPEYPGGADKMMKYLMKETKLSEAACGDGYGGCQKVYIKFTVDTSGKLTDPHVTGLGANPCTGLEQELLRVIKLMPAWKPGMQDGKKVKVYYQVPVYFTLR